MAIVRLPELEDSPYFPSALRRLQVEFIGWMVRFFRVYQPLVPLLRKHALALPGGAIIELGAGSGQVWMPYLMDLKPLRLVLTDKFPQSLPPENGEYETIQEPVDALEPFPQPGMRVFCNAFHHFGPEEQIRIARLHAPHGLCIAEILQPTLLDFLKILLSTTLGVLLFTPWVKPFRWSRLLFTYLIPLGLLSICWDGLVSVLKSDRTLTLERRLQPAMPEGYRIERGHCGSILFRVHYLFILPPNP